MVWMKDPGDPPPRRDKVSGLHLDAAIEPWLAERGFSNGPHESFSLESA